MDKMENHLRWFTLAALSIVVIGVVGLMALTAYAFLTESNAAADLRTVLVNNVAGNFGVPAAALVAFVLVSVLWSRFPPPRSEGEVKLEMLSLRFTGPAGPISLWVICFLAFVFAIWLLKLPRHEMDSQDANNYGRQRLSGPPAQPQQPVAAAPAQRQR